MLKKVTVSFSWHFTAIQHFYLTFTHWAKYGKYVNTKRSSQTLTVSSMAWVRLTHGWVYSDALVFLLHVDWRQLTLGHHRRLVQETDTLVYVEVVVILGRGWGGPHLSTHSHVSYTTLHTGTLTSATLHVSYTTRWLHTALHCTALHCTALHCTTAHYTTHRHRLL